MSLDVYLLRHAESVNNTLPAAEHIPDPPLTDLGRWQAAHLASAVAAWRPEVIVCSPLQRSLDTAAPLFAATGVPWLCWADVVEANRAHPTDGTPVAALRGRFPAVAFEPDMPWPGFPGPETSGQAAARAERLIARLAAAFPDGARVAVVGHGRFNAFLLRAWLGSPQDGAVEIVQGNTCINHLHIGPRTVALLRYNDCAHLA